MELRREGHILDNEPVTVYILTIKESELVRVVESRTDRTLMVECDKSGRVSDKLLALANLARRIEAVR